MPRVNRLAAAVAVLTLLAAPTALAARTYRGDGTRLLRPFTLSNSTTVHWRATGGLFMLIALKAPAAAGPNPQLIVSTRARGSGYLPPGRYAFKVSSFGSWTVTFG